VKLDNTMVHKIQNAAKEPLFSNYQGVMLGDGIVWFVGEPGSMKILAFGDFSHQPDRVRQTTPCPAQVR
jgi:hypothetical protein